MLLNIFFNFSSFSRNCISVNMYLHELLLASNIYESFCTLAEVPIYHKRQVHPVCKSLTITSSLSRSMPSNSRAVFTVNYNSVALLTFPNLHRPIIFNSTSPEEKSPLMNGFIVGL